MGMRMSTGICFPPNGALTLAVVKVLNSNNFSHGTEMVWKRVCSGFPWDESGIFIDYSWG